MADLGLLHLKTSTGAIHPKGIKTLFEAKCNFWCLQYPVAICSKVNYALCTEK